MPMGGLQRPGAAFWPELVKVILGAGAPVSALRACKSSLRGLQLFPRFGG